MSRAIKSVKNKQLNSSAKIRAALKRSNSLTVSVLIDLYSRGLTEIEACEQLDINYKLYRYVISDNNYEHIRQLFNKARAYSATIKHEKTIRQTINRVKRLNDLDDS